MALAATCSPTLKAGAAKGWTRCPKRRADNGNIMSNGDGARGLRAVNDIMNSTKDAIRGLALKGFEFVLPYIRTSGRVVSNVVQRQPRTYRADRRVSSLRSFSTLPGSSARSGGMPFSPSSARWEIG